MRALLLALVLVTPWAAADHTGDILYDPAAAAGLPPTPEEIRGVIDSLRDHPWAQVHPIGASLDGVPLYVVELTDPDSPVPLDERVVTFIMTQQHGNEPAGTPAALRLLAALRDGTAYRELLDNQVLLVMAQSNPDGAVADRRTNEAGADINRDHVGLETPEAQAIHEVLRRWDVHLAFDHHEYGGSPTGGIGHPVPANSYDYDITTMYPNHGNVRAPTSRLSLELNYEHIKPRLEREGYTHGDYGVTSIFGLNEAQVAGGPDPGILRNNYGLNNIAGLLIESFIPPYDAGALAVSAVPPGTLQDFERRVASHEVVMDEALRFAHDNAARVIEAKRASERLNLEDPPATYSEGSRTGPIPAVFLTQDDHTRLFDLHALPLPWSTPDGGATLAAQERAGLVAAMLHPESSRHVEAAGAIDAQAPAAYLQHPDFGAQAEPLDASQEAPAPWLPVLVALVGLAVVRLRRAS